MRRLAIGLCLLFSSSAAPAQQAADWLSKISVHGFISQAYAISDEHQIHGIPEGGTTDYRDLALQLRFDADRKNTFALQVRHQRRGESVRSSEEVELDWGFYQRTFSDRFAAKAGRIPLPLGIFNEAGGPATAHPFFRPPNEFYDRQYTSRTLDGVLGTYSFGSPDSWNFDVDAYAGQWSLDQWANTERVDAKEAYGAQIWANTPLSGVRIGGGAYRCTVSPITGREVDYVMLHGSVDADLDRWRFASEYLVGDLGTYGEYDAWYGQIGFEVTQRFSVHARTAIANASIPSNGHFVDRTLSEDLALAFNYSVGPGVLLKLEGHTNEGFLREDVPRNIYGAPSDTRYLIASVAASF